MARLTRRRPKPLRSHTRSLPMPFSPSGAGALKSVWCMRATCAPAAFNLTLSPAQGR